MLTLLIVIVFFWMAIGLAELKIDSESGEDKLSKLTTRDWIIVFVKSLCFGPYTKSKILKKL